MSLYQLLRWLHILSVFAYLLLHGPSLAMAFFIRGTREPTRMTTLLDLSKDTARIARIPLLFIMATGLTMGFLGGWWRMGWIWAAFGILIVTVVWMVARGLMPIFELRSALGQGYYKDGKPFPGTGVPGPPEVVEAAMRNVHTFELTASGVVALAALLWLMVFKPF
jgi:hypothetical protein